MNIAILPDEDWILFEISHIVVESEHDNNTALNLGIASIPTIQGRLWKTSLEG